MNDHNMNIWSLLDFVKTHGQPRYVDDFIDLKGEKFSALSFNAKSFADNEIKTYTDTNGETRKSKYVMVSFAPNLPDNSMQYIKEHHEKLQVRKVSEEDKVSFVLEPVSSSCIPEPQKEIKYSMTKKEFHRRLVLAIIVDFAFAIFVGVQLYTSDLQWNDPGNLVSWVSLIMPGIVSYLAYRALKHFFSKKIGLIVSITFMVASFIFMQTLPYYDREAATIIEALNGGFLIFTIGLLCIYNYLQKYFDNYEKLE